MNNSTPPSLPLEPSSLLQILLDAQKQRAQINRLRNYAPYPKQKEFHAAGRQYRERLLLAANQSGKTTSAAAEVALHLTGRYPSWWEGKVFDRGVNFWASGITGISTRDTVQAMLMGPIGRDAGTGMIPQACIIDKTARRGLADALDTVTVRHGGGGDVQGDISTVSFKSYDQGREAWQGPTLDGVWYDEEPPLDVYTEGLTRTNVTLGPNFITFTPLKGMSAVVRRFLIAKEPGTSVTQMTIDEALHYTDEQRAQIIRSYPEHVRKARAYGIPQMGDGPVFTVDEDMIIEDAFAIPDHWPQICGLDFGWDHPSAGVRLAWDRDSDVIHLIAAHRAREQTPMMFAAAVRPWGDWLPWAWPHDGLQHDKGSGEQLAQQYRAQGLRLLPNRATFADGSFGVEAGIALMLDRMLTGRFRVFRHVALWWDEYRTYHRKEGLIVKEGDDVISAARYAVMMLREAQVRLKAPPKIRRDFGMPVGPQAWMG